MSPGFPSQRHGIAMSQVTVDAFGGVGTMHSAAWLVTRLHSVDTLRCGKTCRIPKRAGTHGDEEKHIL